MKFRQLSVYLDKLEKTSSRIEMTKILADLFKKAGSDDVDKIVYLLLGQLAPKYESVVFNIAERMMIDVISQANKKEVAEVKKLYRQKGDLGIVAQALARGKGKGYGVNQVFEKLGEIAKDEGEGSQERKIQKMAKLLSEVDPLSARFLARIPVGKLRLGFSDKTIIEALSWMVKGDKSAKDDLEAFYRVMPDVGLLAKNVKKQGIKKATKKVTPAIGVPIQPMLAQRLKSPQEMIKKMGEVAVEPKLDGLRIQIHFSREDKSIKAFTRNMNETSWMFPELKNAGKYIKGREVILDTEAVGVDEKRQKLANFQATMTRRRKHEIKKYASSVPIKFYVFDILFKNGKSFMDKNYKERRKELEKTVKKGPLFEIVDHVVTNNPSEISTLNVKKRKEGLEGIMIKKTDAGYVPGRTGWRWVKMKEAEKAKGKLADTIDCVVMGYSRGRGKRAKFGLGQFLAGVRNKNKIKTITKVGTGLTDKQFKELNKRLKKITVEEKPKEYDVHKDYEPDFWVKAKEIIELAGDELTKSPKHTSGVAVRFPRLVKFRDDKSVGQITTMKEIKALYKLQKT